MVISVKDVDLKQKLSFLIDNASKSGYACVSLYENFTHMINAKRTVPFVLKNLTIAWNVPLDEVSIRDLVNTFELGNDDTFEINEISARELGTDEKQSSSDCVIGFIEDAIFSWGPNKLRIDCSRIEEFTKRFSISERILFSAIWLESDYEIGKFSELFKVTYDEAEYLLKLSGYETKGDDRFCYLNYARKDGLTRAVEAASCIQDGTKKPTTKLKGYFSQKLYSVGVCIQQYGMRIGYDTRPTDYAEPAFKKKREWFGIMMLGIAIIAIVVTCCVVPSILKSTCAVSVEKQREVMSTYWTSIAGSVISSLITILTTYWIIHRSYTVDYHQERMSALPFFKVDVLYCGYCLDARPENVERFYNDNTCGCVGGYLDCNYAMISVNSQGRGPAFNIEMSGAWPDYDDGCQESLLQGESVYYEVPFYANCDINMKLTYYDIYGNYYMQNFTGHHIGKNNCVHMQTSPPKLVLRTDRLRYVQ